MQRAAAGAVGNKAIGSAAGPLTPQVVRSNGFGMDAAGSVMQSSIDAILGSVTSTIKSAVSITNTVCIETPKRALLFYLALQKELFLLPFRVSRKVFEVIVKNPLSLLFKVYQRVTDEGPTPVELLTGEKNPSTEKIQHEFQEIRRAAMKAIRRENRTRWQLQMYRKELENWYQESEKKTEELYQVGLEEKELLKAVAAALKHLKSLKLRREKMSECFSENLKTMLQEGAISSEKLMKIQKRIKTVDTSIKEKKDICLNLLKQSVISERVFTELDANTLDLNENCAMNGGGYPPDSARKIMGIMAEENAIIKEKLSASNFTLERILDISSGIAERIAVLTDKLSGMNQLNEDMEDLHRTLEEEHALLQKAEADRDFLKEKLDILESMIKEEETYLGDMFTCESVCEDSDYSSMSGMSEETPLMSEQPMTKA